MAAAAWSALGAQLSAAVVTASADDFRRTSAHPNAGGEAAQWTFFPSSHPLPDRASEAAGRAALALAGQVRGPGDLLLVLLSGGASAMLCVPAMGISLEDQRAATAQMLRAGLDIGAMNVVRRHLSAIKGGQLAAAAFQTVTLAISDVTRPADGDPLTIGSGPTVGDDTTFAAALAVVDEAGLRGTLPPPVVAHLQAGAEGRAAGPVAPGDPRLRRSAYWIVTSRHDAMRAAAETARQIGYDAHVFAAAIEGEARRTPGALLGRAEALRRPACAVWSGETTVRVVGRGSGGRNQELALAALEPLARMAPAALASVGTDGIDGPTDAAGAIVDSVMWSALGPDPREACRRALDDNDAHPLLDRLGALVRTGATGTNVGDLVVLLLP